MSEKQSAKLDLRSAKNLANLKRYRGGGGKEASKVLYTKSNTILLNMPFLRSQSYECKLHLHLSVKYYKDWS